MTDTFNIKDRVYKMTDKAAEPMYVVGIKRRRWNRDKYLVSTSPREAYIEIVSEKELVAAPLLGKKQGSKAIGGVTVDQALKNLRRHM